MKRVKFFIFILPFLFSSCSQTESDSTYSVNDTLKSVLVTKGESAIWTNELEPKFLTETLESYDKVSKDIKLSPEVLNIADSDAEKIYPQLKDFGSLDTESLSVSTGKIIKDFFDAVSSDIFSAEHLMKNDSVFSLVFFAEDLEKGFTGKKKSDDESKLFTSYLIGSSFLSGSEVQIPIRLYNGKQYADITLFIDEKDNKISQLKIDRWGK